MSRIIATAAIRGAHSIVKQAEEKLREAIESKGKDAKVEFPDTGYYLPIIYSATAFEVKTLGDCEEALGHARALLPPIPEEKIYLPYLGWALDAGIATLFAEEVIEACKYLIGPNPVDGIWLGAAADLILRERGIEFVDGTAPGFAAVVGAAPTNEIAVQIARELQEKNLYIFISGNTNGKSFAEQLDEEGVQLGWETRLVPFGKNITSTIYSLGFANKAALSFGGIKHEISSSWGQEFRRKGIHACALFVPLFARVNYILTLELLAVITIMYIASEWARLNGIKFPILSFVTRRCVRSSERRRLAFAPITLALGVVLSLVLFPALVACVTIAILACADSMATIVGKFYGRIRIPYNHKKSLEGSAAFFITAFICAVVYVPLKTALIVSLVSCIIESLPIEFDNISIPLGTGLFLGLLI